MADLLFVLITMAFFALCVAYVGLVDRVIGPDEIVDADDERDDRELEVTP